MVLQFAQMKQNWKNYRDQGWLTFLAPLQQNPSRRKALIFVARERDSKVTCSQAKQSDITIMPHTLPKFTVNVQ